jgi:hypothetical protein
MMNKTTTPLFTLPVEKPELRCLKLASVKTELSMAAIVRRGIGVVLNEISPEDGEAWNAMQSKRASRRSVAA